MVVPYSRTYYTGSFDDIPVSEFTDPITARAAQANTFADQIRDQISQAIADFRDQQKFRYH